MFGGSKETSDGISERGSESKRGENEAGEKKAGENEAGENEVGKNEAGESDAGENDASESDLRRGSVRDMRPGARQARRRARETVRRARASQSERDNQSDSGTGDNDMREGIVRKVSTAGPSKSEANIHLDLCTSKWYSPCRRGGRVVGEGCSLSWHESRSADLLIWRSGQRVASVGRAGDRNGGRGSTGSTSTCGALDPNVHRRHGLQLMRMRDACVGAHNRPCYYNFLPISFGSVWL